MEQQQDKPNEEIKSEWDQKQQETDPVLLSDFEHKAFLVIPSKSKKLEGPEDILDKDLSLSVLDQEQAFIYNIKAACAEEWLYLGFPKLSARRKTHLKIKLGLLRSIGGIERFLQTGTANVNTEMDIMNNSLKPEEAVEKKTGQSAASWKNWFK